MWTFQEEVVCPVWKGRLSWWSLLPDVHLQIWAEHHMGFAIFLKYLLFQDIVVTSRVMWESKYADEY